MEALEFAQQELAPRGEESPEFLAELERTMALLAFHATPKSTPQAIKELLSPAQRSKTAGELNRAILASMSHGKEAKLVALIKLLCWGEATLEEKADFAKVSCAAKFASMWVTVTLPCRWTFEMAYTTADSSCPLACH